MAPGCKLRMFSRGLFPRAHSYARTPSQGGNENIVAYTEMAITEGVLVDTCPTLRCWGLDALGTVGLYSYHHSS